MTATTVNTTYAMDEETQRALESLARRWGVSESEALRQAIRAELAREPVPTIQPDPPRKGVPNEDAIAALRELHESVRKKGYDLDKWERDFKAERAAWPHPGEERR